MADIAAALIATLCWCGTLLLWLLIRAQGTSASIRLKRYLGWTFVAWSASILLETLNYIEVDWESLGTHLPWFVLATHDVLRKILFRGLIALAVWQFIWTVLQPHKVSTVPVPEAQIQMDAFGVVVTWDVQSTNLLGWTAEEMIGQELAALVIPPPYQEAHRQGLAHYRQTAEAPIKDQVNTLPALTKDGRRIVVDIRIKETLTSQGTLFTGIISPAMVLK
jgi:PAS domain S-box-containing protein